MAKASNLVPLLVLFVFVGIAAFIGFIAYSIASDVGDKAAKRMEKKNIKFTKEGMKVGVKQISTEDISDSTQSTLIKVWNSASWPAYKSKLGWGQVADGSGTTTQSGTGTSAGNQKPYSRANPSQRNPKKA